MAATYIATKTFTVGAMNFSKGDVVPWSLIGSTAVIKRLLAAKKVRKVK